VPVGSGRGDAAAAILSDQHLQSERLVADDTRPAIDHVGISTSQAGRRAEWYRGTVHQSPGRLASAKLPWPRDAQGLFTWDRFFRAIDGCFKFLEQRRWLPLRKRAVKKAEQWMIERFEGAEGLGAIFPPMVWSIIALRCLGYRDESPEMQYCRKHLDGLIIEEQGTIRLQPCKSPIWDTAITLRALEASGIERNHEAVERAEKWLLDREVTQRGDWARRSRDLPAVGASNTPTIFIPMSTTRSWSSWPCGAAAGQRDRITFFLLRWALVHQPGDRTRRKTSSNGDRAEGACRRAEE